MQDSCSGACLQEIKLQRRTIYIPLRIELPCLKPDFVILKSSCCYWSYLYSAILCSQSDSLCSHVILHEWITFYSTFFTIHWSGVLTALAWLCHMKLLPCRHVLCTPYSHTPCHFMQSHIHNVHAYLAVTCHPHFWQNDWGLLRNTGVEWIPK